MASKNPFDKLGPQQWPALPEDTHPSTRFWLNQLSNFVVNARKAFVSLKNQQTTTQTQTETIVQQFQSGGNGNVFGPPSSTPGDAAVFADASGKQLADVGYPPVSPVQVQNESLFYADDTGGAANTYVAVLSPVVTSYLEGLRVALKIAHTSTGASTLDAGAGATTIKKLTATGLADIAASDLQAGDIYVFRYDGTVFQVQVAGSGGGLNGAVVKTSSYAPSSADSGKLIVMNGGSLTLTLPNPVPSSTWFILVQNINASDLTISRNSLTIDGAASNLTVGQNQGVVITTDGTNYDTERGLPTYGGDLAYLTGTTQKVVGILDKAIDASSPTDGQLPQYQSATGKWELVYVYQKSQGGVAGSPSASQPMCWANIIQPVAFAADFAGSQGMIDPGVGANPAATVTLTVKKWVSGVATTLGTISISTSGVFTFATTSHAAQSAGTGDLVAVYNQNPADASLAYPTFALAGYLGSTAPTNPIVSGGAVSGPVSSTNNDIALFDGTPGNVIKDSGVQISTDGTMASNSDSLVPTQKAVVTYIGANATRGWQLLEQHTASSSSSLDFTSISSSYDTYVFEFVSLVPATNAANLTLVAGTGAGPSWDTTSGHYKWDVLELFSGSTGSSFPAGSDSAANILLSPGLLSAGNTFTGNGQVILYNPQSSTTYKHVVLDYSGPDSNHSTNFAVFKGGGAFVQTTAMTGVRFIMTSGAIASGTIRMYGLAK